ncbi:MAG: hypothetical protein EOO82_00755 [Oxalobacteraceae bacterium]|nr:MAG: hypothetical protein EOO82_00755 [Oxalobacteraceae bacterium]
MAGKSAERVGNKTIATPEWEEVERGNARQRDVLRRYVDAVNRKDVDAIVALFASDGVVEDPYGGTRHFIHGTQDLRAFYTFVVAKMQIELLMVTGSGGNAAAMAIRSRVADDSVNNISVAEFNEAGLIIKYTTYWGPGDRAARL